METEKELGEASCISEKEIRKEMPRELGEAGRKLQKAEHEVLSMIQLAREGDDVRPKNAVAVAVDAFAAAGQAKAKKGLLQGGGGGGGTGLVTTLQVVLQVAGRSHVCAARRPAGVGSRWRCWTAQGSIEYSRFPAWRCQRWGLDFRVVALAAHRAACGLEGSELQRALAALEHQQTAL